MNLVWALKMPWKMFILFGGGLCLAGAIQDTGLASYLGRASEYFTGVPIFCIIAAICLFILLLTELASNTATVSAFFPVVGAMALGINESPLLLVVPVALVGSCAFMLPVATPPNAIVFGSGLVRIPQMVYAGFWMNICFLMFIPIFAYTLVGLIFL